MNLPTCIIFMFTTFCLPNLCRSQPREFSGACCASWLWLSPSRSASSWKNKSYGTDSKYQTWQLNSKVVFASVKCTNVTKTIMMSHVQLVFHLPTLSMSTRTTIWPYFERTVRLPSRPTSMSLSLVLSQGCCTCMGVKRKGLKHLTPLLLISLIPSLKVPFLMKVS